MSFFSQFPILETERLVLRQLRYEDGVDIHAYFNEGMAKYYDWLPKTVAEGRGFVRFFKTGYQEEQSIRWGITLKPYDQVIGEYKEKAFQSIEGRQIPQGMQDIVKDYFSSLED